MSLFEQRNYAALRNQPNKSKILADIIRKKIENAYSYRQDPRLGSRKASFRVPEILKYLWYDTQTRCCGNNRFL